MTNTVSTEASEALARLDHVLGTFEAAPTPDLDWMPGDPIHDHPDFWYKDEQYVRPMIELLDDGARGVRCEDCQVSWRGPEPCWVCGKVASLDIFGGVVVPGRFWLDPQMPTPDRVAAAAHNLAEAVASPLGEDHR